MNVNNLNEHSKYNFHDFYFLEIRKKLQKRRVVAKKYIIQQRSTELFKYTSKNVLHNGFMTVCETIIITLMQFKYRCETNSLIISLKIFKVSYFEYYRSDYGKVRHIWLQIRVCCVQLGNLMPQKISVGSVSKVDKFKDKMVVGLRLIRCSKNCRGYVYRNIFSGARQYNNGWPTNYFKKIAANVCIGLFSS